MRPDHPPVYRVSELTGALRRSLESDYGRVTVRGEISNLRRPASGHLYFALKDADAQLRVVLFRGAAVGLRFTPADGLEVEAEGEISLYEPRGDLQLIARSLAPSGVGALMQAYEALKRRLAAEGLFSPERKRPLPPWPRTIAVVTSSSGAAFRDIVHVIERRWPLVRLVLAPVRVQGEGAAAEIARAVEAVDRWGGADLMIVGRGGGSLEDLWAFNEEVLARALAAAQTPVISAVGHEIDTTISDLVADVRAPTPSAAAELAVPDGGEWIRQLRLVQTRLHRTALEGVAARRREVLRVASAYGFRRPEQFLRREEQRVDDLAQRLQREVVAGLRDKEHALQRLAVRLRSERPQERLPRELARVADLRTRLARSVRRTGAQRRARLVGLTRALEALSPGGVLERGYCLVRDPQSGKICTSAEALTPGDTVVMQFSGDRAVGQVSSVERGRPPELEPSESTRS